MHACWMILASTQGLVNWPAGEFVSGRPTPAPRLPRFHPGPVRIPRIGEVTSRRVRVDVPMWSGNLLAGAQVLSLRSLD